MGFKREKILAGHFCSAILGSYKRNFKLYDPTEGTETSHR